MATENQQPDEQPPALQQPLNWAGLPEDTRVGLESIVNGSGAPILLLGQLSQLEKRAQQEPEAAKVYAQVLQNLHKTLELHYKTLNLNEQELQEYIARNIAALKNPQDPNQRTAVLLLRDIGNRIFSAAPQSAKDGLAAKAYESHLEQAFGIKLSDAWKTGSLIDALDYNGLAQEQQAVFEDALKTGKSPLALLQMYATQTERAKKEQAQAVKEELENNIAALQEEIKKYTLATVKAYGFSDELANHVAENPMSAQLLQPLFSLAMKKVTLTLGADRVKETKEFHLQQRINMAYGAPQAQEEQAE